MRRIPERSDSARKRVPLKRATVVNKEDHAQGWTVNRKLTQVIEGQGCRSEGFLHARAGFMACARRRETRSSSYGFRVINQPLWTIRAAIIRRYLEDRQLIISSAYIIRRCARAGHPFVRPAPVTRCVVLTDEWIDAIDRPTGLIVEGSICTGDRWSHVSTEPSIYETRARVPRPRNWI